MENNGNILSKENSLILRGLAILSIMFHNYLHMVGFCRENEGSFVQAKVGAFFGVLAHPGLSLPFDLVSFLGWLGVPVFVFLTGYGLAVKYGSEVRIDKSNFLKNNYLKLFFLLFPAMLFFAAFDVLHGDWSALAKRVVGLSMLHNLYYPRLCTNPTIYWYFSLTFQYYILYCFCGKWFKPRNLLILSVLSLVALYPLLLGHIRTLLSIYKHCFTGWFPLFALGIWFARDSRPRKWLEEMGSLQAFVLLAFSGVLVVVMSARVVPWLVLPVAGLFAFLALAKLALRVRPVAGALRWTGGISACIFVCHPIARFLLFQRTSADFCGRVGDFLHLPRHGLLVSLAAYAVLTFVFACLYQKLQKRLLRKL